MNDHLKELEKQMHADMNRIFDNIFGETLRKTNEAGVGPIYEFNKETGEITWK